jgi:retron-type reverse transcriptase
MQTLSSLYNRLCSFENLYLAYRKARKGKRGKIGTADFEFDQEGELLRLQEELVSGAWRPGAYHSFYIHDPKRRLISAAPFRDRVVHHALCNLLEPTWERRFIHDSYANRVGKGTHRAILRCQEYSRRYPYVLQCDLEQYFPSIDHAVLRSFLARQTDDPLVLDLVDRILASGVGVQSNEYQMHWFPGDDLWAASRPRGLPIGNLTSQFWANVYLNDFDHFVKRELRCLAYLRYVDDFLLFAGDKTTLKAWEAAIRERLSRFRLTLHPPQVYPVTSGIPFLGFRIFPTHRRLKKNRGIAFQRRFRALYLRWLAGDIPRERLDATTRSWAAHAAWGDTYGLRRVVLGRVLLLPR